MVGGLSGHPLVKRYLSNSLMLWRIVQDELHQLFQSIDRDGNGRLDVGEFRGMYSPIPSQNGLA